jgi:hypothetical protein
MYYKNTRMDFVSRPKKATIKFTHPDNSHDLCASAEHVAEILREEYGVNISRWQSARLCSGHVYKRAAFELPDGVVITRLNSTKASRRNQARAE